MDTDLSMVQLNQPENYDADDKTVIEQKKQPRMRNGSEMVNANINDQVVAAYNS